MNHCLNCGNELTGKEKFCSKCGAKVNDSESKETTATFADEDSNHSDATGNELKEKFSSTLSSARTSVQQSGYFNYLTATLKKPTTAKGTQSSLYGWLNILLLAVTTTWTNFNILKGTIQLAMSGFGISSFFGMEDRLFGALSNELIPRLFIFNFLGTLVFAVCAILILKFIAKTDMPFNQMLSEFGGFLTPNIALTLVAALLTTLIATDTTLLIALSALVFSTIMCFAAYNFYLYDRLTISGLDNLYVLFISNFIIIVVISFVMYSQLEPVMEWAEQMDSVINQFNW